jgi:hypothetical protein
MAISKVELGSKVENFIEAEQEKYETSKGISCNYTPFCFVAMHSRSPFFLCEYGVRPLLALCANPFLFSFCPPDAPENVFTQEVKVSERWVPAFLVPFEVQLVTPTWAIFGIFEPL